MKNFPLLYKVLDHIEAHPSEWFQAYWMKRTGSCGTTCCFAGFAVMFSLPTAEPVWVGYEADHIHMDGSTMSIHRTAMRELGLNAHEAGELFCGTNSLEDIRRLIEKWEAEEAA